MLSFLRYFTALKENRELIMNFAIADVKNRYRNSILGVAWTILEPLLLLSVLYIIFSAILRPDVPNFAIYLLLGLISWNFIRNSTMMSIDSISSKKSIFKHVYFMRAIPAFSSNISALIILGIEFVVFSFFLIGFGVIPSVYAISLPFFIFLTFLITLGISLPLSVLSIPYKDIKFIWNVIMTAGFFLHPIIYTIDMLPPRLQEILLYVPTVKIIDIIHNIVLFDSFPNLQDLFYITGFSLATLIIGYLIYRQFEYKMIDDL